MLRNLSLVAAFALLTAVAPACMAAQFVFANGNIKVTVPDSWPRILQASGDPETMVFQAASDATARVTITTEHVLTLIGFKEFVVSNTNRAQAQANYKLDKLRSTRTAQYYTAMDGQTQQTFAEHYSFDNGYAVLVRCVRPSKVKTGASWAKKFDKACAAIAASVKTTAAPSGIIE